MTAVVLGPLFFAVWLVLVLEPKDLHDYALGTSLLLATTWALLSAYSLRADHISDPQPMYWVRNAVRSYVAKRS